MATAKTVERIALEPKRPARRASPEESLSRRVSMLRTPATSRSSTPATRLPPTQKGSITPWIAPTSRFSSPKTTATRPSAPSNDERPLMARPARLAPSHRLHRGLGQQQEAADHHGEVGEVGGRDEALHHLLEVRGGRDPAQDSPRVSHRHAEVRNRGQQQ